MHKVSGIMIVNDKLRHKWKQLVMSGYNTEIFLQELKKCMKNLSLRTDIQTHHEYGALTTTQRCSVTNFVILVSTLLPGSVQLESKTDTHYYLMPRCRVCQLHVLCTPNDVTQHNYTKATERNPTDSGDNGARRFTAFFLMSYSPPAPSDLHKEAQSPYH